MFLLGTQKALIGSEEDQDNGGYTEKESSNQWTEWKLKHKE